MKILNALLIFAAIPVLFSLSVSAQDSNQKNAKSTVLKGKIWRSDTKAGIPKVKILLMDEKKSDKQDNSVQTETGDDGAFIFENLKSGKYTISIRASFEKEEDVPCQLLMGKISEPNSQLLVLTEDKNKIEQIFIKNFSIKEGKTVNKEFDLVCQSLFSK